MLKKIKIILLCLSISVFIFWSFFFILQAQGLRFDFKKIKFTKTGGIFISTLNSNAQIYLNGKLKKNTTFFSNSILIKNLLPKKYNIEVKKRGFSSWRKSLAVKEGKVTEIKEILLVKKNLPFKISAENIKNILISEKNKKILAKRESKGELKFLIFDIPSNGQKFLNGKEIFSQSIKGENNDIELIDWNSKQKQILLAELYKQNQAKSPKKFLKINYGEDNAKITKFTLKGETKKIILNPNNKNEVLFLANNALSKKDFSNKGKESSLFSNIIWFEVNDKNLFWLTKSNFLGEENLEKGEKQILNETPLLITSVKNLKFKIKSYKKNIYLEINGHLFYYLRDKKKFKQIFNEVRGFAISPLSGTLVFWTNQEIHLFYGEKNGKTFFLNRFSEPIKSCFWLNSHYLVFNSIKEIAIIETDNRDRTNISPLAEFENPKIFLNGENKKLYVLENGVLSTSESIVPRHKIYNP